MDAFNVARRTRAAERALQMAAAEIEAALSAAAESDDTLSDVLTAAGLAAQRALGYAKRAREQLADVAFQAQFRAPPPNRGQFRRGPA